MTLTFCSHVCVLPRTVSFVGLWTKRIYFVTCEFDETKCVFKLEMTKQAWPFLWENTSSK